MQQSSIDIEITFPQEIYILVEKTINNHTKYRSESGEYYEENSKQSKVRGNRRRGRNFI